MSLPDMGFDVQATLQRLRTQRDALSETIAALEKLQRAYGHGVTVDSVTHITHAVPRRTAPQYPKESSFYPDGAFAGLSLGEACLMVLETEARPMTNQEIAAVLSGRPDVSSKATNMPNNVGTSLWREMKVKKVGIKRDGPHWSYTPDESANRPGLLEVE